jgi:aryl-alcohol dehydrogenase-like predicted oxidoreductase
MRQRRLGKDGPSISAFGLGCMGMSGTYGAADEAESVATIHAAIDAGVTLFDTGDFYGQGHNELLLGRALKGRRDKAFIAVKFGGLRDPKGVFLGHAYRPAQVKSALAYTLVRLGTDHIDLYQPARIDPAVPIEETIGAMADLVREGYVRHIGMSEASPATVRRAQAVHPIVALQIEYSLICRGIERDTLPAMRELGIGVTAYGVLCRGLLSGAIAARPTDAKDVRLRQPRFDSGNFERNLVLVERFRGFAAELGATPSQLALAWVLARGDDIVPLIGTHRRAGLQEAIAALEISLTADDIRRLEAIFPPEAVAGERYAAAEMKNLDSETGRRA